jgi:heptosyltransferase-1
MKSILIIRPSAIGDIVMASPMIRVLRDAYPRAHIAWLVEPSVQDLLCHHPALDELILWPKAEWNELLNQRRLISLGRRVTEFSRQMRLRRFDLALDAQGLLRSRGLAWLSGARKRIGFSSREPGRFLMTNVTSKGPRSRKMGSEYKYLMEVLGLSAGPFHPEIVLSAADEKAAFDILATLKIGERYAVFSPFTTRPQKHWFEERWAELAGILTQRLELPVVLLGGPADQEAARRIRSLGPEKMYNLTGRTSLGQGAALIKNATLLAGVDTGLTHMGAAFDCPTVALFGATCPYRYTAGHSTLVIYNRMSCSPCRRSPVCSNDFTCMKSIQTGQVLDAVMELLKFQRDSPCTSYT